MKLEENFEQVLEDMKKYLLDGGQVKYLNLDRYSRWHKYFHSPPLKS